MLWQELARRAPDLMAKSIIVLDCLADESEALVEKVTGQSPVPAHSRACGLQPTALARGGVALARDVRPTAPTGTASPQRGTAASHAVPAPRSVAAGVLPSGPS
jgi:hypothetical protein